MTTQYTPILKLALPVTGELSGTWGDVVNDNITSMVEQAVAGLATINTWTTNSHTLTTANGTTSESRCAMLVAQDGAGLSASGEIVCPASSKLYVLKNATSYQITLKTASGTGVAVASGNTAFLFCDGTNVNACVTTIVDGRVTGNLTVDGNATVNGNTTLGNATSDTITATARFASGLTPSADNTYDLGSASNSWKDLYVDGTIFGATLDLTNLEVTNIKAKDGTASITIADSTGAVSFANNVTLGDASTDTVTVNGYMGIGGAPASNVAVYTRYTGSGGTTQYGLLTDFTGSAASTAAVHATYSRPQTAAAAFTAPLVTAFYASNAIKGAGSTITDLHGLYIADQTQGTNNYGITSAVSSGSNKWNIYASGTAANYFAGNVGIGITTASTNLEVAKGSEGLYLKVGGDNASNARALTFTSSTNGGSNGALHTINATSLTGAIAFATNSAERMRLFTSGGLSIGDTTDPGAGGLRVTGNTTLGDASTDTVTVNGYMGVGAAAVGSIGLYVAPTATTSNSQYGFAVDLSATSGATTVIRAMWAKARTPAAAVTFARLDGLNITNAVKGAGSTITDQYGLIVDDQTQGTNNYGITSLVSSGTNKWNIYASGTAANYFAGNVGIGTAASDSAWASTKVVNIGRLGNSVFGTTNDDEINIGANVINTGSGTYIYGATDTASLYRQVAAQHVWYYAGSGTAGAALTLTEAMRINASGNVGIGTSSPGSILAVSAASPTITLTATTTTGTTIGNKNNRLLLLANSSTVGNGGEVVFGIADTDTGRWGAISGAITANSAGGAFGSITFATKTLTTDTTLAERMRIDSSGNVGIGTSSFNTRLHVVSAATGQTRIARFNNSDATPYTFDIGSTTSGAYVEVGASGSFTVVTGGATRATLDSSGNLGLGVTPSAWGSGRYLQVLSISSFGQQGNGSVNILSNAYESAANAFSYVQSSTAAGRYNIGPLTGHTWYNAASGTAGAAITFTQAMTLDTSGRLLVGTTSASGSNLLQVNSDALINGLTIGKGLAGLTTNTALGVSALSAVTTGSGNVAIGYQAMDANTTGQNNIAIGSNAIGANQTAQNLIAIGTNALVGATAGDNNIAIGASALNGAVTGGNNVAVGASAMAANTSGAENTAIGYLAMSSNTTGANNTALGRRALWGNTTTSNNVAIGYYALDDVLTGGNGTAVGYNALGAATGGNNTALGYNAGGTTTTGTQNLFLGYQAGNLVTTGGKNVIIGAYQGGTAPISATGSNYIVLSDGDANIRQVIDSSGNVGIGTNAPVSLLDLTQSGATSTITLQRSIISSGAGLYQGQLQFGSYSTGTTTVAGSAIRGESDGTWTSTSAAGRLLFYTTASGATTLTERMRLDASGNLGLGVTPSAWQSNWKAIETYSGSIASLGTSVALRIYANAYVASGGVQTYKNSDFATRYEQVSGTHAWYNAPSGTAGATVTFTQAMTLDASGNLLVGSTTAPRDTGVIDANLKTAAQVFEYGLTSIGSIRDFYNSGSGRTFTITGGTNGSIATLEIVGSSVQGYVRKVYCLTNGSGLWTVAERESAVNGTTQTVTVSGSGTATATINVLSSTANHQGGLLEFTITTDFAGATYVKLTT